MSPPSVRAARPEDVDALARVHERAWEGAYRGIVPAEALAERSYERRREQWREVFDHGDVPRSATLVAEVDGDVVGFLSLGESRDEDLEREAVGEVHAVNVDPAWWGRGVGTALLEEAVRRLRARGFSAAVLWAFAENERAIRFYEARGWTLDGAESAWEGVPTIRYRTTL